MGIRKVSATKARSLRGTTNWQEVKRLTDKEIKTLAVLDPDARELRPDELMHFKRERNK
jgi:hypothetical protein